MSDARIQTFPPAIYIAVGDDEPAPTYEYIMRGGGENVCWCEDKQDENDVKYVRADLFNEANAKIAALEAELAAIHAQPVVHHQLRVGNGKRWWDATEAEAKRVSRLSVYEVRELIVKPVKKEEA